MDCLLCAVKVGCRAGLSEAVLGAQLDQLAVLLPGVAINLDVLSAAKW